jgi:hypothetical protein
MSAERTETTRMALKATIDKSTFESLSADLKKEYVENGGKFVLQVEGMKPESEWREAREKLAEFRDNNRELFSENATLKTKVTDYETRYKDLDPDKAREALDEVSKIEKRTGGKKAEELDAFVKQAIDTALKPVTEKLTAAEKRAEESQREAEQAAFREQIGSVANAKGVKSARLRHVLLDAAEPFEYRNGKVVAKAGRRDPSDPGKDLTPEAWFDDLMKNDPDLFERSGGGGAEPPRSGFPGLAPRNGNARVVKVAHGQPISYRELGVTEDQVIKGEVIIERTS